MKTFLITISATAMLLITSCGGNNNNDRAMTTTDNKIENVCDSTKCCNATADEIAGIRKALDLYCEASVKGDSKIAEPAFAPTATMSYAENGKLVSVPIKALFDYYDQTTTCFIRNRILQRSYRCCNRKHRLQIWRNTFRRHVHSRKRR